MAWKSPLDKYSWSCKIPVQLYISPICTAAVLFYLNLYLLHGEFYSASGIKINTKMANTDMNAPSFYFQVDAFTNISRTGHA